MTLLSIPSESIFAIELLYPSSTQYAHYKILTYNKLKLAPRGLTWYLCWVLGENEKPKLHRLQFCIHNEYRRIHV